jgi:hypothetical protein
MADHTDDLEDLRQFMNSKVLREVEEEKVKAVRNQALIARVMEKTGSLKMEGIGQKVGAIDIRTFMRWQQMHPGCWNDPTFREEMLRDNAHMRAPGYRPKKTYKPTEVHKYAIA